MPVIPSGNEGQRLEQRSPVEGINVNDAGRGSRMFAQVGEGMEQLGAGLIDFGKRQQAEKRERQKIDVAVFREEAEATALMLHDKAIKDSSADGENMPTMFGEQYSDWYKNRLDQIEDPDVRRAAAAEAMNIGNTLTKDLFEKKRAKFVIYGTDTAERMTNQVLAGIRANPDNFGEFAARGYENMKRLEPFLSKTDLSKRMIQYEKDAAESHVMGYVEAGKFDQARAVLVNNHGGKFSVEERTKLRDKIDSEEFQRVDRDYRTEQRRQQQAAVELERKQNNNFEQFFTMWTSGQEIEGEVNRVFGTGGLRKEQFEFFTKNFENVDKTASEGTYFNLLNRAMNDKENIRKLMDETAYQKSTGRLNNDDAISLMKTLNGLDKAKKDSKFSDPAFTALKSRHLEQIDRQFGSMSAPGMLAQFEKPQDAQRAALAKTRYIELVYFNGYNTKPKMDQALRMVFKERGGTSMVAADVPALPGMDTGQIDDDGLAKDTLKSLQKDYRAGKMSAKEYEDALLKFKTRKQYRDEKKKWDSWGSTVSE